MEKIRKIGASKKTTIFLGGCIGAVVFLLIYGIDVLRFTNVAWLGNSYEIEGLWDLTQHYMGWVAYRNTPYYFPLIGLTEGLTSEPISVMYTDSIPLFAVLFKMLSPILPTDFQYFGLFEFLTYILVGALGTLVTFKYSKNIIVNEISAVFFVLSPVLLKRTFYHSALSAHFLIIAAILLWIYAEDLHYKKSIIYWSVLSALSLLINPYYIPMVIGIMLCMLLQRLITGENIKRIIFFPIIPVAILPVLAWPLGMFYGGVSPTAEGIELVCYNLFQLINPADYPLYHNKDGYSFGYISYSKWFSGFDVYTEWQNEGFSYLGLGIILLITVAAPVILKQLVSKKKDKKTVSFVVSIGVGFLIFLLLAMGPHATAGHHVLYYIIWPEKIYNLFSVFRTAGRMIWPVHFGLMALALICMAKKCDGNKIFLLLLIGCVFLQWIELTPAMERKHDAYTTAAKKTTFGENNPLLLSEGWQYLSTKIEEVIFVPPTGETIYKSPFWSCTFVEYCQGNQLKMNASYCSRNLEEINDTYAENKLEQENQSNSGAVYVAFDNNYTEEFIQRGMYVYRFDDLTVATYLDLSDFSEFQ